MIEENEISIKSEGGTEITKRMLGPLIPEELLNETQIICSRVRTLDPTKIRILWMHDLPEDPESSKLKDADYRNQFHHFVFVSNWQYERYRTVLGFPYSEKSSVIPVGISPAKITEIQKPTDKIKLVYTSTPQRGLDILLATFDAITKNRPELPIELDVFSSFKIYGWPQQDEIFKPLFDFAKSHPKINYKGFVPNKELLDSLNKSHIFAYPSTWAETSCRALTEAMSAQLICVHPNFGALPETSCGQTLMYDGDSDKTVHSKLFYVALENAIELCLDKDPEAVRRRQTYLNTNKYHTDFVYNVNKTAHIWSNLIANLKDKYPNEGSRAIPKAVGPVFKYKV